MFVRGSGKSKLERLIDRCGGNEVDTVAVAGAKALKIDLPFR
jgi:hypothetical protein